MRVTKTNARHYLLAVSDLLFYFISMAGDRGDAHSEKEYTNINIREAMIIKFKFQVDAHCSISL